MVITLLLSAKVAALGLLKIKVFWNKTNDIIVFVHYSNYTVDVVMWPNFGNCSISMREVVTLIL